MSQEEERTGESDCEGKALQGEGYVTGMGGRMRWKR